MLIFARTDARAMEGLDAGMRAMSRSKRNTPRRDNDRQATTPHPCRLHARGTRKALVFHERDLPARDQWDALLLGAMGSPDPYGRQLDGMGGGASSL